MNTQRYISEVQSPHTDTFQKVGLRALHSITKDQTATLKASRTHKYTLSVCREKTKTNNSSSRQSTKRRVVWGSSLQIDVP